MKKLDVLGREEFVNKLMNITKIISENKGNVSFAIDGVWGSGKSFVLNEYEEQLFTHEQTNNYFVIRYNCWKYDYYEEPLIAIVSAIIDIIEEKTHLWDESKRTQVLGILKAVGATLLSMASGTLKAHTGVDAQQAFDVIKRGRNSGKEMLEEMHKYDVHFSFNKALQKLQTLIQDLAKEQTVVLLVDELDRCLPQYGIKVLERLHHLSEGVSNIVTVVATDKTQLAKSIQSLLGFEDASAYLKKFIQFELKLNKGDLSESITDKYLSYIECFECDEQKTIEEANSILAGILSEIDIRTQEQLMQQAELIHKLTFLDKKDFSFMCMEVLLIVLTIYYGDWSVFENRMLRGDITTPFRCCCGADGTKLKRPLGEKFQSFFALQGEYTQWRYSRDSREEAMRYCIADIPNTYEMIMWYWSALRKRDYEHKGDFLVVANSFQNGFLNPKLDELNKFVQMLNWLST